MKSDLGNIRRDYNKDSLNESTLPGNPLEIFQAWMDQAIKAGNPDPTAMALSTVERDGQPSSRIVLLKKIEKGQFIFFTNYHSHKARDIREHIRVSALFFWSLSERQVKISGTAWPIDDNDSDAYFESRPFESKVSAWASPQSEEISGREYLEKEYRSYLDKFEKEGGYVPRPGYWGGYAINPLRMEFWQGRENRLHDRIEYRKTETGWNRRRLAP